MAKSAEHSRHSGTTCRGEETPGKRSAVPSVGERLYSQVHVCNHTRCAANKPDYAVKAPTPSKTFLVAKKHTYGGLDEKAKNISCDHVRGHALHTLTNSVSQPKSGKASRHSSIGTFSRKSNSEENRGLYISANSTLQQGRVKDSSNSLGKKGAQPKGRAASSPHQEQRKSGVGSSSSSTSPTADLGMHWEDSSSPRSSVTANSVIRGQSSSKHEEDAPAAAPSPTASIGSNHSAEISRSKENVLMDNKKHEPSPVSETPLETRVVSEEVTGLLPSPSVLSKSDISGCPTPSVASNSATASSSSASVRLGRAGLTSPPAVGFRGSRAATSESPTLSVGSNTSRNSPNSVSTTPGRSSFTTPPSVASKLARKFINNLKESSRVGLKNSNPGLSVSLISPVASAKSPSRNSKASYTPASVDSSASKIARKFITELQASTSARKGRNSTKGVRSIELRGGKAQTYSTTTVTSWNVTTTTVETSLSASTNSPAKKGDSGNSKPGSAASPIKPPWSSSTKGTPLSTAIITKEVPKALKFGKKTTTTLFDEVSEESETVSLKHGEVSERRLSEEWMTNHALEGVVKNLADKDHRVKVLVHAFESLATLSDSEGHCSEDMSLKIQMEHEVLSATPIAV